MDEERTDLVRLSLPGVGYLCILKHNGEKENRKISTRRQLNGGIKDHLQMSLTLIKKIQTLNKKLEANGNSKNKVETKIVKLIIHGPYQKKRKYNKY